MAKYLGKIFSLCFCLGNQSDLRRIWISFNKKGEREALELPSAFCINFILAVKNSLLSLSLSPSLPHRNAEGKMLIAGPLPKLVSLIPAKEG